MDAKRDGQLVFAGPGVNRWGVWVCVCGWVGVCVWGGGVGGGGGVRGDLSSCIYKTDEAALHTVIKH